MPVDLRRRFTKFRDTNAPMTRVPDDLRAAVLRAIAQGTSMLELRRELGVTVKQVTDWRRHLPAALFAGEGEAAKCSEGARVFDVADKPVVSESPVASTSGGAGEVLELCVGAWVVVIRPRSR